MGERKIHHGELETKKSVVLKNGPTFVSIGLSKNDPDFLEIFCPSNHASNVSYLVLEQDLETGGWKYVRKIDNPDKKTKFNLPNGDALQINLRNLKNGSCSCVIYHIYFARGVGFYYINADLVE